MIPEYRIDFLRRALGSRYDFEAFLGRGAFATVLLVRNRKLGRQEALKVLQESFDGDHEFAQRFVEEAKLVASLDHPNIVKVYDYGEVDGVLWYSMQYIDGPSLSAELKARKPMAHEEVVSLAVPLLDALAHSHEAGVVHRDVKPGNIMISRRGRPYLMDFGIAKVQDSGFKTATGSVLGTPAFISPEQASGESVDGRSDVYSLGVCLYQMITGSLPFTAPDPVQLLLKRLHEDPLEPSALLPTVDPELEAIILKSLTRSAEDRFQNAEAMRDRILEAFRSQIDVEAVRVTAEVAQPTPLKTSLIKALDEEKPPLVVDGSESTVTVAPEEMPTIATQHASAPEAPPKRRLPWAQILLVSLVAVGSLIWLRSGEPTPSPQPESPQEVAVPTTSEEPVVDSTPGSTEPALSDPMMSEPETGEDASDTAIEEVASGEAPETSGAQDEPEVKAEEPPAVQRPAPSPPPPPPPPPPIPRKAVVPPAILDAPDLELDAATSQQCSAQEVILTASIDAAGELTASRVLVGNGEVCQAAALDHVKRYRFQPGRDYADEPVDSKLTLSIRFP